jgi:hypothetical protein
MAIVCAIQAHAQAYSGGAQTRAQITQPVDEARLVTLPGNTHPAAIAANDRGPVADDFRIDFMQLVLQRPPELEKQLEQLIQEQQRKGSPEYHRWLTSEEFNTRFGVAPADIEKVTHWLQSRGFKVDAVLPNGMVIDFSGTAGEVKQAFHTGIHKLDVHGVPHIANMSDPRIPAALADAVKGVYALHDFKPRSMHKRRAKFTFSDEYGTYYAVVPQDMATIYNLNPAFSQGITGAGQNIVVIEDTLLANPSDVSTFRSAFGLSGYSGTFSQVTETGAQSCSDSGVNGDEVEAALDAEWAGAAAPEATVTLASCADTEFAFGGLIALQNILAAANPPQVVSISYGACEAENGAAANATYIDTYQQAAALGISVFVSAGDEGAASCDADQSVATHGIAVSGFASTPYNVAVGGTDFGDVYLNNEENGPALSSYWNTTDTSAFGSAISYIPEIPWNSSCASALLDTLYGYTEAYGSSGFCNSFEAEVYGYQTTASGSGGPSTVSAQPSWQSGVYGLPTASNGVRYLPDVSLFAADGVYGHFYEYCMSDTSQGGTACDYTSSSNAEALAAGGTSFASPIWAGIQALVNQSQGGKAQGNPNPRYYELAGLEYGAAGSTLCNSSLGAGVGPGCVFYDVTLGDMDVNCTGPDCYGDGNGNQGALSSSTSTFSPAYGSNTGWDYATGLGTVNVQNLIADWTSVGTTTAITSSVNPSNAGQQVTFTATVMPGFGGISETGSVTWSANTGCGSTKLSAGVATCATSSLPAGADSVKATYSGDSNFTGSNAGVTQTVNQGTSPAALTLPAPGSTLTSTSASFTWTAGSGATAYWLYVGTTGVRSANVYSSGSTTATSLTVNNIPANGVTLYVTLFSNINGTWTPESYTYTESGSYTLAAMTGPAPGSTLTNTSATFTWSPGGGPTAYWLYLGTTGPKSVNVFNSGATTATSLTVNNLPANGVTIYATLFSEIDGVWQPVSYTYTESGTYTLAEITGPAPGSKLTSSSATFTWSPGAGPTMYYLYLGTTGGNSYNVFNSGNLYGTSVTVNNIPANGGELFATLFSNIDGAWQSQHFTFVEPGTAVLATMTNPAQGSTLGGSSATFQWNAGSGVTAYWLYLGTEGAKSANLYSSGSTTAQSIAVNGLPANGVTVYATLYSEVDGAWQPESYTYTEAGSYSLAALTNPAAGSVLPGASATFTWSAGAGATGYWLYLGTAPGAANIYSSGALTGTSVTVNNLPTNGETVYATLYSQIDQQWKAAPVESMTAYGSSTGPFLALSSSGTYLINQTTGNPVYLNGEDGWSLATQLDNADADTYLSTRASQGYNLIWVAAADNVYQSTAPDDYYGYAPFSGADFTNENSSYWPHIDWVIQDAGNYGIIVALDPAFAGLNGADGYLNSINNSSCATLTSYGQFLGARYKSYPNILWATAGDANPGLVSYANLNCLDQGIRSADPNHLMTMEACPQGSCGYGNSSTAEEWTAANVGSTPVTMNLNWVYNQYQSVQSACAANYAAPQTAGPSLLGETWYENTGSLTALQVREEGYWSVLSGCTLGYVFGNSPIWCFNSTSSSASCDNSLTWKSQLTSNGSVTQQWMGNLMRSREFWKMAPDSGNNVLTGGYGSGTSISAGACTSDGQTCIIYDPLGSGQPPQIAMSHFTGTVQPWWFNPQTGATTQLATVANSGTVTFTPTSTGDWVLVLDLASAGLPAPGTSTVQ